MNQNEGPPDTAAATGSPNPDAAITEKTAPPPRGSVVSQSSDGPVVPAVVQGAEFIRARGLGDPLPLYSPEDTEARCTCGGRTDDEGVWHPCESPGKHPRIRGWEDDGYRTEPHQPAAWANNWPRMNLGNRPAPDILVVDVDDADKWRELVAGRELPETLRTRTPGRDDDHAGHWYFRIPTELGVRKQAFTVGGLHGGIDLRYRASGQVVVPPSLHYTGTRYRWVDPEAEVADAPAWLLDALRNTGGVAGTAEPVDADDLPEPVRKVLDSAASVLKDDGTVNRSDTIYKVVAAAFDSDLTREQALGAVRLRADLASKPGHEGDVRRIWDKLDDKQRMKRQDRDITWAGVPTAAPAGTTMSTPAPATSPMQRFTEYGDALELVARYGEVIRYCPDRERWLTWDGHTWRWQPSGGGQVREYAKQVAGALRASSRAEQAHQRRALSAQGVTAVLRHGETDPPVVVNRGDLDAHPWELNTPGGIVNLRTGELLPAEPTHLHTQTTACTPDPTADRSAWLRFLADTFGNDEDLKGYLQRLVGYSAVGEVGPHILPFCHGSGANGKGVFIETCTSVLGDYAAPAPRGFLMAGLERHETEIARLAGKRMVVCSEVNERDRFDEAKVKLLTGGDRLTGRFMRADHFEFTPTHQLWLVGNHRPAVESGGESFFRRFREIGFTRTVPEEKRIDGLQHILAGEHGPAVLAWIVEGAAEFAARGLVEPQSVQRDTAEYAHDQDTVGQFLDECVHRGDDVGGLVRVDTREVRSAYERFCRDNELKIVSSTAFGLAMRRAGIEQQRSNGRRFYLGITVLDPDHNAGVADVPRQTRLELI